MEKMEATGHITPSDMRGVFHSTKLSGQKTGWQKQLDDEFKAVSAAKKAISGGVMTFKQAMAKLETDRKAILRRRQ